MLQVQGVPRRDLAATRARVRWDGPVTGERALMWTSAQASRVKTRPSVRNQAAIQAPGTERTAHPTSPASPRLPVHARRALQTDNVIIATLWAGIFT